MPAVAEPPLPPVELPLPPAPAGGRDPLPPDPPVPPGSADSDGTQAANRTPVSNNGRTATRMAPGSLGATRPSVLSDVRAAPALNFHPAGRENERCVCPVGQRPLASALEQSFRHRRRSFASV